MSSIQATIERLSAARRAPLTANFTGQTDRLADLTTFGTNPGALQARTFVPANLSQQAALVVVLHGCTQTAAGYDHGSGWSTVAEEYGFALLFPSSGARTTPTSASTGSNRGTRDAITARRSRSGRWSMRL